MARLKLTPEQIEQIRAMAKEGKKNKEIIDFFRATYNIALNSSRVCYVLYGREGKGVAPAERKGKPRKYHSKKKEAAVEDVNVSDLVKILNDIESGYKSLLRHIRAELIKSRAQVYDMMRAAGIEVKEEV